MTGARTLTRFTFPACLFLFALIVRALPIRQVFLDGHVRFADPDAYYHMRRIAYSIYNFPAVLDFDPYINFPHGARAIWTPMFDWCIAALLWPLHSVLSLEQLEAIAAWAPPLIGACTVLALYATARRHFSMSVAVGAGAILSVLSGHAWYSKIGFLDHHVGVSFATTLLLAATMGFLQRVSDPHSSAIDELWSASLTGAALGAALLLWPGSLIHVGVAEIGLLAYLLTRSDSTVAISFAMRLSIAHLVAFALTAPGGLGSQWDQWSDFSPTVLSHFQPWFFGTAALFSLGCATLWRKLPQTAERPGRRALGALGVGALLLGVSLLLWPTLSEGVAEAWAWFSKTDDFQGLVGESMPIFEYQGEPTLVVANARLSYFFLLTPFAILFLGFYALRSERSAPVLFLLWWTAILCLATVFQKRFFNSSSVALALLFSLTIAEAYRLISKHLRGDAVHDWTLRGALFLLSLWLLSPTLAVHRGQILAMVRTGGVVLNPNARDAYERYDVSQWMRKNTPETSGWLDASIPPEYGVMAPWSAGHAIEYIGRRPTINTNFGDDLGSENFLLVREYYFGDEEAGTKILDALQVKLVVAQSDSGFLGEEDPGAESMYRALYTRDGSELGSGLPALQHYRLLYESQLRGERRRRLSLQKLFEYVPGARLVGRASPGARVRARVKVTTNRERSFVYATRVTAGPDGLYELRVPYATTGAAAAASRTGTYYSIECNRERKRLQVPEEAVREGSVVQSPSLCLGPH